MHARTHTHTLTHKTSTIENNNVLHPPQNAMKDDFFCCCCCFVWFSWTGITDCCVIIGLLVKTSNDSFFFFFVTDFITVCNTQSVLNRTHHLNHPLGSFLIITPVSEPFWAATCESRTACPPLSHSHQKRAFPLFYLSWQSSLPRLLMLFSFCFIALSFWCPAHLRPPVY